MAARKAPAQKGAFTHNAVAKIGSYTTPDGEEKARWVEIGSVYTHSDGKQSLLIKAMPVGASEWDGWVSLFPIDRN